MHYLWIPGILKYARHIKIYVISVFSWDVFSLSCVNVVHIRILYYILLVSCNYDKWYVTILGKSTIASTDAS